MAFPPSLGAPILNTIAQPALVPVTDHIRYLVSCKKIVRDMRNKKKVLDDAKANVESRVRGNNGRNFEIPSQVGDWLEAVKNIYEEVESIPTDVGGCLNIKIRHKHGRKASRIIEEIDNVIERYSLIPWTDNPIPIGMNPSTSTQSRKASRIIEEIDNVMERHSKIPWTNNPIPIGMNPSTSTQSSDHYDELPSRKKTFAEALEALELHHNSHVVALCGMGGVGKSTMMQRLKKAVQENEMFNYVVEVVIGEKSDPIVIQGAIAEYLGIELKEAQKPARADKLRKWFENNSEKKTLVILDNLWEHVDLNDIGLGRLPNQSVNFKVLLTSQDRHVCFKMGDKATSVINVNVLTESEGQNLFCQFVKKLDEIELDHDVREIAIRIANRCQGLPIAIKAIANNLIDTNQQMWEDELVRLDGSIDEVVEEKFKMSYDNLHNEETESIFLLCGLFPKDSDIPTEDLMRYGWGLNKFDRVSTIRQARIRLNRCIERLMQKYLLMESDDVGRVKIHDLLFAFVLGKLSNDHATFVGRLPGWPERLSENLESTYSCKKISSTCQGMSGFPGDLKFPNLLFLKLMHGDVSLKFHEDFYSEMKELQVIAYDQMKCCPLLPSSLGCSTKLRVLHLHQCSFEKFDCSSIGNLWNLEVLSFANSNIEWLPSTIGKLKKLRLLDLTNCDDIRIDNGVFTDLVSLEELYAIAGGSSGKPVRFTDDNYNQMGERLKNLDALEFQFIGNAQPKNMSFKSLKRFKISVGRSLDGALSKRSRSLYENTLQLVINKGEVDESEINKLFDKTEVLSLTVGDMNNLEAIEVNSTRPRQHSSFYNLKVLVVSKCAELEYLFTQAIAKDLPKLEHLQVDSCEKMKELIGTTGSGKQTKTFPKLKFLKLSGLKELSGLCCNANIIELPQLVELQLESLPKITSIYTKDMSEKSSLLKGEVVTPKLDKLYIDDMKKLEDIWTSEFSTDKEVMLREIDLKNCDNLVNLFPCNPMSLLHHLEQLKVENCCSIEVLFNINLSRASGIGEGGSRGSLRSIQVKKLGNLREVWRIKDENISRRLIRDFQTVENVKIINCKRFKNLYTPATAAVYLGALMEIMVYGCQESGRNNDTTKSIQEQECQYSGEIDRLYCDAFSSVIPLKAVEHIQKLKVLKIEYWDSIKEVFETQGIKENRGCQCTKVDERNGGTPAIPRPNNDFMLQLPNLKTLEIIDCKRLEHILTFSALKSLTQLTELTIKKCTAIEVIVKEENGLQTLTTTEVVVFDHLKSIALVSLPNLRGFFLGKNDFQWPSLDYVIIRDCPNLKALTRGRSTAPELVNIDTSSGTCTPKEYGLTSHVPTTAHHQGK